jgi:hypothetical protein
MHLLLASLLLLSVAASVWLVVRSARRLTHPPLASEDNVVEIALCPRCGRIQLRGHAHGQEVGRR